MIDPKGHHAGSPWQMPWPGWKDIAARTYKRTWDDNVALIAAGVAFYAFFALLSLLGLIVLTYGAVAEPLTVLQHMRSLTRVLPADVALLIGEQLMTAVQSSQGSRGIGILLAVLVALYGGTNGASAIMTALNIAYEEKEKRSLLRFYALALGLTVSALGIALAVLASAAAVASLQRLLPAAAPATVLVGKAAGYLLLTLFVAALAASLYRYAPSREDARWKWITPGSLFAAIVWMLLTVAFGAYLTGVADYSASYGSLGAAVALLSWLYLSAYAFLFGAELNSEIEHQTVMDSTTGPPEPMGSRGAWAADNVATDDTVQDRPEEVREGERLTRASPDRPEEQDE